MYETRRISVCISAVDIDLVKQDGVWLDLPTTKDDLYSAFENLGVDPDRHELRLVDYEAPDVPGLRERIDAFDSINELNYLALRINGLEEHEYETFLAALEGFDDINTIADAINTIENLDEFSRYENVMNYTDLGYTMMAEAGFGTSYDNNSTRFNEWDYLQNYFDYEQYGSDIAKDENGHLTDFGYILSNEELPEIYHGEQDIPEDCCIYAIREEQENETPGLVERASISATVRATSAALKIAQHENKDQPTIDKSPER